MSTYVQVWKRALEFSGRSRRREYWLFVLFNIVISLVLALLDSLLGFGGFTTLSSPGYSGTFFQPGLLSIIFSVAALLPGIAVAIRRLHDTDRSGFWVFITFVPFIGGIVLLVFLALAGTRGSNRFGADPKSAEAVTV